MRGGGEGRGWEFVERKEDLREGGDGMSETGQGKELKFFSQSEENGDLSAQPPESIDKDERALFTFLFLCF